jgi:cytochrome c oxidase cbb3-type subunit 4
MEALEEFLRSLWVLWLMAIFVGIVAWVYWPSRRRKRRLQDHANIPLRDEEPMATPRDEPDNKGDRRPE